MSFRGSSKAPSHCCFLIARPLLLGLFVFECEARTTVAGYFFWKRLRICIGMTPLLYVAEELGGLYWCLSWMTPKVFRADGGLLPPVLQKRLLWRRRAILSSQRNLAMDWVSMAIWLASFSRMKSCFHSRHAFALNFLDVFFLFILTTMKPCCVTRWSWISPFFSAFSLSFLDLPRLGAWGTLTALVSVKWPEGSVLFSGGSSSATISSSAGLFS